MGKITRREFISSLDEKLKDHQDSASEMGRQLALALNRKDRLAAASHAAGVNYENEKVVSLKSRIGDFEQATDEEFSRSPYATGEWA